MIQQCCPNPVVWQRLYAGPLGAHIDTCAQQLLHQGYASWTAKYTMRLLADLSSWLQRHAFAAADLHEQRVNDFLQDRYGRCRPHRQDRSIFRRLLTQLRDHGVLLVPMVETESGACSYIEDDFQHDLLQERGLAPTTVRSYRDTADVFSAIGAAPNRSGWSCSAPKTSPAAWCGRHAATALRSFFRFLLQHGVIQNDLPRAVPTVPNWRLSGLPQFLNAEDVTWLLQSCDQRTPQGQREYAMLLLLARLGLRAGEVATLRLDDLDWAVGELLVRSKGARDDRLPLPHAVGEA